jgi:hypothetical protein
VGGVIVGLGDQALELIDYPLITFEALLFSHDFPRKLGMRS